MPHFHHHVHTAIAAGVPCSSTVTLHNTKGVQPSSKPSKPAAHLAHALNARDTRLTKRGRCKAGLHARHQTLSSSTRFRSACTSATRTHDVHTTHHTPVQCCQRPGAWGQTRRNG
eukprot:scaffold23730_cov17-Tisochrysis_lutea.AAC.1